MTRDEFIDYWMENAASVISIRSSIQLRSWLWNATLSSA